VAVVVVRVGWGSGAAHVHAFVVVWEVSEEVGGGGWFGECEKRKALAFWSGIWGALAVR